MEQVDQVVGGAKGQKGQTGPKGSIGPKGEKGQKGQKGQTGSDSTVAGPKGQKGQTGADSSVAGPKGIKGAPSSTAGPKGQKGDNSSVAGPKGQKGQKGDNSSVAGPKGTSGTKGSLGPTGPTGTATSIANNADNRVTTATGTANELNAEANMTFNGSALTVTGNIFATEDVVAYYSSDKRFKNNIITIPNVLDKFDGIRGVEFDWNSNQELFQGHDIGVVAQEIESVFPELVKDREDGYKGVRYEKLVAVCIQAIKELKEEIHKLKNEY